METEGETVCSVRREEEKRAKGEEREEERECEEKSLEDRY